MNLNILKSFLVTSETKNLTKASELLNYSQSTVSTHIEKLERQLDVKLFYRKKYGMELTEEGLAYVKYAKVILDSNSCLLYTSPSPRDMRRSRMPSSA
ncbi:hypothetical protein JMUB7531_28980 [Staphylococcus aureus]